MSAINLCYVAAGIFFTVGLGCGIWKYIGIVNSEKGFAHEYINILHRASLLYSFACILLSKFVELSSHSEEINFFSSMIVIIFFAFAQITYLIHAILKDTENQFSKPYKLGDWHLPGFLIHFSMVMLIASELGGFLVLFWGYLRTIL